MFKFLIVLLIISHQSIFGAANCEVFFSPQDHLAEKLIQLIDQEQTSIKVAIYAITHAKIMRALENAQERGVAVELIIDPFSMKSKSPLHRLVKNKMPVYVWDPPATYVGKSSKPKKGLMHDKFCVFGDHLIWTGSFNFTYDGEARNEENAIVIDNPQTAKKYLEHFDEIKMRHCRGFSEYLVLHPKKKSRKNSALAYTRD